METVVRSYLFDSRIQRASWSLGELKIYDSLPVSQTVC